MILKIKQLIKKLLHPHTYSSEAYLNYLHEKGVEVGKGCYLWDSNSIFLDVNTPSMLHLGNYVKITRGAVVLCHDYSWSTMSMVYGECLGTAKETYIGDNVFIGMNAIILMGTHIGANSIVGAGAVVSGTFPEKSVIVGNPAMMKCTLDELYEHRKSKQLIEAQALAKSLIKKKGKVYERDMKRGFGWLYLTHTEETIAQYPYLFELNGVDCSYLKRCFLETKPIYQSFEEFIRICTEENEQS